MKNRDYSKFISQIKFLGLFVASVYLTSCSGDAGHHISRGIKCMESPLASYCAPIAVEKKKLKYEAIDKHSKESVLKSTSFMNKYSEVYFGISKVDENCSDTAYDIESLPNKSHFYKFPEGTYKICVKYYLSSSDYSYKSSETIKVVSSRKNLKNSESWFVKEIRKHSRKRNTH